MKNKNVWKYLYVISFLLLIAFVVGMTVDYFNYDIVKTSAPFYANIIVRSLEYLLPSIVVFIIAIVYQKKSK